VVGENSLSLKTRVEDCRRRENPPSRISSDGGSVVGGIPLHHSKHEWEGWRRRENPLCHVSSEGGSVVG
jgi:hypothetical protein